MFWCAYHTWIWPFLFASRSCSFLFPKWITGNSPPEMCLCVCLLAFGGPSPHFLVSCYLKIGVYRNIYRKPSFSDGGQNMVHHKVFQTNQFSDCIFFCTWLVIELSGFWWAAHSPESIQRSNWVQPEGSEISWHRYGADLHYTATGRSWLGKVAGFLWVSGICWAKNGGIFDHSR